MRINGTLINYYFHCKRQCYLHGNRLNLEDNSEQVKIGKAIHEERAENSTNSEIAIENICLDKLTKEYLVEVKKSDADPESAKWQLLYYLSVLKKKGILRKGKLEFVEKNKKDKRIIYLELTDEVEKQLFDYIQEIGRAARDKNITGVAVTDFNERDFYYMKRLHSAGAISQEQLGMILKKVWEIYLMKGCSDEMQMSLSDFEFAVKLPRKKNKLEYESDLEQVVKTALLWIEEDLSFRHGGSPVEINSQTLFSDGYVQEKTGDAAFRKKYKQYMVPVKGVEGVYKVAFESLWENCFSEMGYREFKRDLYNGNLFEGVRAAAVGKHDVLLKESAADICSKLASLLKSLKDLLTVSLYGNKGKFEEDDLRSIFAAYDMDVPSAKRFITSLLESRVEEGRSVSYITSAKKKDEDKLMFTVTRGFDLLLSRYQKLCAQRITGKKGDRLLFYVTPFSDLNMLLNLLSMLNVVDFTVEGGVPSVGVRVRDAEILKKEAASEGYQNRVLENNEKIFQEQIELFRLFFGNTKLSDEQRWEFIEDYFTGMNLEGLKEKYSCVVE